MSSLPEGWVKKVSKSTGKEYYYNTSTNESQWEIPTDHSGSNGSSVRASHLLVKHEDSRRPSSWKQEVISRSQAEALNIIKGFQERIIKGETTLGELARTESDCSSARKDGDLGFFSRGQMQKPFEEATYGLDIGEMSDPVYTDSGIHLILRTG